MEFWEAGAICGLFFIVAVLYSSVGHGGASGYLAVMSFFTFTHLQMSTTALILNTLVSGTAFVNYYKGGHFGWRLVLPFVLFSIPMAFIGGTFTLSYQAFSLVLASVLLFAAFRLMVEIKQKGTLLESDKFPPIAISIIIGGGIGFISGLIGVGGGIFLSPIILFKSWADPKRTAAVSAFFILMNSLAGLGGRFAVSSLKVENLGISLLFVVVAFLGGLTGSYLGSKRFSGLVLNRLLGVVLIIAATKLVVQSLR